MLCNACPLERAEACTTLCSSEYEQIEKVIAAEELWEDCNQVFERITNHQILTEETP